MAAGNSGTVGAQQGAARVNPATKSPGNSSREILAWAGSIERDARRASTALETTSVDIYKGIMRSSSVPAWAQKRVAAVKMRLLIRRMAAAEVQLAKNARALQISWRGAFGEPGNTASARSGIKFNDK
jgi:hypothetical protein